MSKKDWSDRAACRIYGQIMQAHGIHRECDENCWKVIRQALKRAEKRGLAKGHHIGYQDAKAFYKAAQ